MPPTTRRKFLTKLTTGAAATAMFAPAIARGSTPSERFRIGVIGLGSQGKSHLRYQSNLPDVEVAYIADVDESRLGEAAQMSEAKGVQDFRRILDDPTIDGVTIASPDHWHTPMALMALDAGKHVYVEKPCTHNYREGQLLAAAVANSGKVVQHGTQTRSSAGMQQAMALLHDGLIGDILVARCWNWQTRDSIGKKSPTDPPSGVDYDAWVGPAEWMPYQENRFHYDWHWWFNFGTGDMGNDGVHELDYTLWGLGVDGMPSRISGNGGIYFFDDDREWPDTQQVTFEFETPQGKQMLMYEQWLWSNSYPHNVDSGVEFYGTKGKMFVSKRGKIAVDDEKKNRVPVELDAPVRPDSGKHHQNWVETVKGNAQLNAPTEIAVRSAAIVHLGNIATRLHRTLEFNPATEEVVGDTEANSMLARNYRQGGHWSVPRQ